jgi:hypothetical protein
LFGPVIRLSIDVTFAAVVCSISFTYFDRDDPPVPPLLPPDDRTAPFASTTAHGAHHQHRGRGARGLVDEHRLVGQGQVHRRRLHTVERRHRLGQLAFEGPLVVDPLAELRGGDALVVEQCIAVVGRGQALAGHVDAQVVHIGRGYQHGAPGIGEFVRHALGCKCIDHRRGVGR